MNELKFARFGVIGALCIGLAACGGGDQEVPAVPVVKLMARTSMTGGESARQAVDRELASLKSAGVVAGASRCAVAQTNMPAFSYYLEVEVPADQLQVTLARGFRRSAELVGGREALLTLDCNVG